MKKFIIFFCFCLNGCFRSTTPPDPQASDTVVSSFTQAKKIEKIKSVAAEPMDASWNGLYDEKDIIVKIYFEFNSIILSEHSKKILQEKIVDWLNKNPFQTLILAGYADWYGKDAYNENLGYKRAQAVADFLKNCGIDANRLEVISLGSVTATHNLSKTDALKDRRCDVVLQRK